MPEIELRPPKIHFKACSRCKTGDLLDYHDSLEGHLVKCLQCSHEQTYIQWMETRQSEASHIDTSRGG